jgi:DNA-binding transcriptional LysR family regulator
VWAGVDLHAVRTFIAAADTGRFQEAAVELSITQQAVSKRIAALEKDLKVRLFTRTARGAQLTIDGQAFLPHARELLRVAERADGSVLAGALHASMSSTGGSRQRGFSRTSPACIPRSN